MKHVYIFTLIACATVLCCKAMDMRTSANELEAINMLIANDPTGAPAVYSDDDRAALNGLFAELAGAE